MPGTDHTASAGAVRLTTSEALETCHIRSLESDGLQPEWRESTLQMGSQYSTTSHSNPASRDGLRLQRRCSKDVPVEGFESCSTGDHLPSPPPAAQGLEPMCGLSRPGMGCMDTVTLLLPFCGGIEQGPSPHAGELRVSAMARLDSPRSVRDIWPRKGILSDAMFLRFTKLTNLQI